MATIVLIRPGCTDYDNQSRLLGRLEMPLNDDGRSEVASVVDCLNERQLQPQIVYSAPVDPARASAQAIADAAGVKVKEIKELCNVDQGLWQGLPESDVRKRYPKVFRMGREQPQAICPPEGESLGDACERMKKVLNKAISRYSVFAVVVPDPVASVIRCTLEGRGMELGSCLSGEATQESIEIFEADSFEVEPFVNAVHSAGEPVQKETA